jgi:hypothetical protein
MFFTHSLRFSLNKDNFSAHEQYSRCVLFLNVDNRLSSVVQLRGCFLIESVKMVIHNSHKTVLDGKMQVTKFMKKVTENNLKSEN